MDRKIIKFFATIILVSMSLSIITSCDSVRKRKKTADQTVIESTYKFCDAILGYDTDTIAKLSEDDDSEEPISRKLKYYYSNPAWDAYDKKIADAILESMTYRVDKFSVLASYEKEEGTVDVVFSFVDYKKCKEENDSSTKRDFYDILKEYDDTTYIIVPFEYKYDDEGEWVVEDFEKIFIDLFTWKDFDFSAVFDIKSCFESLSVTDYDGGTGLNSDFVNLTEFLVGCDVTKTDDDWLSCYCILYIDGVMYDRSPLYESSLAYFYGSVGKCDYFTLFVSYEDYFQSGDFEVVLYDFNGNEIGRTSFTNVADEDDMLFIYGDADAAYDINNAYWSTPFDGEYFKLVLEMDSIYTGFDSYFTIEDEDGNICYESDMLTLGTLAHKMSLEMTLEDFDQPDGRLYLKWYDSNDDLIVKAIFVY